ncbi:septation protein SepH [Agromyces sp. Soil535]|uniref:septation protein SepH n=1 Tax=Agromyces sp. Soil535 TaxID=1736390 RepID=UPI0006F882ED|nr:septation protein SepH [Agromyces sp. Soil535]KRE30227.1 DNA-binding protein [Agromyces sp. Soil535]
MQELKVIGVENGALLAASDDGARFRIEIDEVLQSRIRQAQPETHKGPKPSPREVQSMIRSGLSAEDVAQVTGASVDYIRRFEGPVLAEREHVVTSALAVPVHVSADVDPADEPTTFGGVIRDRLAKLSAHGERWASWKDEERGWIVKLEFTADTIDHDARWGFEPRKQSLHPMNSEATTLSQQGELKGGLIPRLRAVAQDVVESRFDSGAFTFDETDHGEHDTAPHLEPVPYARTTPATSSPAAARAAIKRADEPKQTLSETADLLEALRRRRGEREAAVAEPEQPQLPMPLAPAPVAEAPQQPAADVKPAEEKPGTAARALWGGKSATGSVSSSRGSRKGRASMPSWDEIVFGARTDDDLA